MNRIKKNLFFFCGAFLVSFLLIHAIVRMQVSRQTNIYIQEIDNLHSRIEDRFKLFIDAPLAIALVSSDYMSAGLLDQKNYEKLAQHVLTIFDELLGLTILDPDGKIIKVYPLRDNPYTLGKISQNTPSMRASVDRNEPYWLSPPFKLYQGPSGFTFYVPMFDNGKLLGWIAPIISIERFFKKFIKAEHLRNYHLIIKDQETGQNYFESSLPPDDKSDTHQHEKSIRGRKMIFMSWKKRDDFSEHAHWPFSALIALILAVVASYAFLLFEQKVKAKKRLEDVSSMLKITSKDIARTLDAIHHQLSLMKQGFGPVALEKVSQSVGSIEMMLQQITILQRLAEEGDEQRLISIPLIDILDELWDILQKKLFEKNINLNYSNGEFKTINVLANKWLLCQSVFANILFHAISGLNSSSQIDIRWKEEGPYYKIMISHPALYSEDVLNETNLDHALFIAQKIARIQKGDLHFDNPPEGGGLAILTLLKGN